MENVTLLKVIKSHILVLFTNIFKTMFQKFSEGITSFERIKFSLFNKEFLEKKSLLSEIKRHFGNELDEFYDNVDAIGSFFSKLNQKTIRFDQISMLFSLLEKYNMIRGTNLEAMLINLERELAALLKDITKNLSSFMQVFEKIDIFKLKKSDFSDTATFSKTLRLNDVSKTAKEILESMKDNYRGIKNVSTCKSI